MVIIGILGALGAARFFERTSFDVRAFADQTKAMLRYAQKVAIAQNRPVYVRLDSNSIALCFDSACSSANLVFPPAGTNSRNAVTLANCKVAGTAVAAWFCEGVPSGLAYALTPASTSFYFDPQGKPYAADNVWPVLDSTFARLKIRISGDDSRRDIMVEPETGYVY